MNRCQVCDKTDEDDPKAGITIVDNESQCLECRSVINSNLEDLSINDDHSFCGDEFYEEAINPPEAIVVDDDWLETPLPTVSEQ